MVTDENFGELLIEGLEEIAAHQRGEHPGLKTVRRFVPPRLGEVWENDGADGPDDLPADDGLPDRLRW